jgi:hypothetical protein
MIQYEEGEGEEEEEEGEEEEERAGTFSVCSRIVRLHRISTKSA